MSIQISNKDFHYILDYSKTLQDFALGIAFFIILLLLNGCSDSSEQPQEQKPSPEVYSSTSSTPPDVVKLGAILPLTGDLAKYGKTSQAAIQLAIEELNLNTKTSNVHYEVIFANDKMSPKEGVSAAKKLISVDNVSVIIGPLSSTVTKAVAPIVESAGIVLLSPGASAPGIADIGGFIFRNALSDTYEGQKMGVFAYNTLGLRKIAIYHIYNDFGIGLAEVFQKQFVLAGGVVPIIESFPQKSRDHKSILNKIKEQAPEAIYLIGYDEMISVFRQAKEQKYLTQWLSSSFLNDQFLVDQMNGDANGSVLSAWKYNPKSENPRVRAFVEATKIRTDGIEPDVFSANAYDAIYLIDKAIQMVGISSLEIAQGLLAIKDFNGVTGGTKFESNGDVVKSLDFKKVVEGRLIPFEGEKP